MKKFISASLITVLFAGIITVTSCSKGPLVVTYNVDDKDVCLAAKTTQQQDSFTFNINHADVLAALTAAGVTDLSRVTNTKLSKLKAVITTSGSNFDQILDIAVYLKLPTASGDGDKIAFVNNISNGATEAVLTLTGTDIKQILSNDMALKVKIWNKAVGNAAVCFKLTGGTIDIEARK